MEKKKVLLLIDSDSLVYSSSKETLQESIDNIDEKVENIFRVTRADYYVMYISLGTYFRHTLAPEYKAGRKKYPTVLLWTRTLKNYLIEKYGAIAGKNVEADDLCAYFFNKELFHGTVDNKSSIITLEKGLYTPNKMRVVMVSPDKDLLKSIPGTHFNYSYFLQEKDNPDSLQKGSWVTTTKEEADEFIKMQTIVGDAADSISGLVGKGQAYWKKISSNGIPSWGELLHEYINHHKSEALGIYEFQKNYRLLHLLDNDSDFFREVGYTPEFMCHPVPVKNNVIEEPELNPAF